MTKITKNKMVELETTHLTILIYSRDSVTGRLGPVNNIPKFPSPAPSSLIFIHYENRTPDAKDIY